MGEEIKGKEAFLKAFLKMQKELPVVKETEKNPFFNNSKYADLRSIWLAIRDVLNSNGFMLSQVLDFDELSSILITKLTHSEGYCEISRTRLLCKDNSDPQKIGSALTYYRRYSITSILGLVTGEGEDDGNLGSTPTPAPKKKTETKTPVKEKEEAMPISSEDNDDDYVIPFGKFKGKALSSLKEHEIRNYVFYIESEAEKKGVEISGAAKEFVTKAKEILPVR